MESPGGELIEVRSERAELAHGLLAAVGRYRRIDLGRRDVRTPRIRLEHSRSHPRAAWRTRTGFGERSLRHQLFSQSRGEARELARGRTRGAGPAVETGSLLNEIAHPARAERSSVISGLVTGPGTQLANGLDSTSGATAYFAAQRARVGLDRDDSFAYRVSSRFGLPQAGR